MPEAKEFTSWDLMNMAQRLGAEVIKTFDELNKTAIDDERVQLTRSLREMLSQYDEICSQAIQAGYNTAEDDVYKTQVIKIVTIRHAVDNVRSD